MGSLSPEEQQFTLLPLSLPADAPQILRLHYQVYLSDPLHTQSTEGPPLLSEEDFTTSRMPYLLSRFSKPSILAAKIIPTTTSASNLPLLAYIIWNPPTTSLSSTPPSRVEIEREIRKKVTSMGEREEEERERMIGFKIDDHDLSERFLGKGFESRFWELDALVVDEKFQRRGLGSWLVEWGLERVREDVLWRRRCSGGRGGGDTTKVADPIIDDGQNNGGGGSKYEDVVGAFLVASPQGERTYVKAGFEKVGERTSKTGRGEDYTHSWFVKKI